MSAADDFAAAVEILPGRLFFVALRRLENLKTSTVAATNICFTIDDELTYEPFFADFGPLNLGKTFRFVKKTQELLQEAERAKKRVYFYCGPHAHYKANAAVLIGIYQVLFLNRTADEAYRPLLAFKPFVPFRDASCGVSTFHLTVLDVVRGIQKARDVGFIDWNSGNSTWNNDEYEHYEQVENGDLNWIVPGKLVAFSGPAARGNEIAGYRLHTPEDYWDYWKRKGVTAVIRLNKKVYDRKRFTDGGFRHYDLYFPDGSCPTEAILLRFLEIVENEPGACAVHCKAGLGRTGALVCAYMMKHFKFTAEEVIGYIRVCRPGSVIGPQQNFLREVEARVWQEGELYRQQRGINKSHLGLQDLAISGKSAAADVLEPGGVNHKSNPPSNPYAQSAQAQRQYRTSDTPASGAHAADMSLLQYSKQAATAYGSGQYGQPMAGSAGLYGGILSSASHPRASAAPRQPAHSSVLAQRSITPLRYTGTPSYGGGGLASGYNTPPSPTTPTTPTAITAAIQQASQPRATPQPPINVTRSMPVMGGRAPSADRAGERNSSSALRATLHTETLRAADRPMAPMPERTAQSADVGSGWSGSRVSRGALGAGSGPVSTPLSSAPRSGTAAQQRPGAGVTRTLAPNGQPRKIPISMLPQYHAGMANQRPSSIISTPSPEVARMKSVAHLRYGHSR